MSLQVWLPLLGNLNQQGLSNLTFSTVSTNTTTDNSGKIGQCYKNDSHSAGGLISNTTISLGTSQSMFCWFKFTDLESASSLGGALVSQHRYATYTGMGITIKYVSATTGYLSVNTGNGSGRTYNTYCGTTLLQANTWYHGGYTYNGSTLKIYVNGVCENTVSISGMSVPSDYITVFCWSLSGSSGSTPHNDYKLIGSLNDVRVYDHCLSQKEVKELAKGLYIHFPLDDPYVENTLNFVTVQRFNATTTPTGWGGHSCTISNYNSTNDPIPIDALGQLDCTYSGSGGGGFGWNIENLFLNGSTTYTYSAYIKTEDNFATANANLLYRYEYTGATSSSQGTKVLETGCYSAANREPLGDGWYRCWGTFTANSATNYIRFYFYGYPNKNCKYWVGCWQVENKDHMTPFVHGSRNYIVSGSSAYTIYDASGYKNNGESKNDTGLEISNDSIRHRYCTYFNNGLNNYIRAKDIYMSNDTPITMSVWIRSKNGVAGTGNYHMPLNIAAQLYEFSIDNNGKFRNGFSIGGNRVVDTTPNPNIISDKKWHMITATYDGANIKRYVDGVLVQTQAASGALPGGKRTLYVGTYGTDTTYGTKELYESDIRVYATALSADDIKELYQTSASIDNDGNLFSYEIDEV